MHALPEGDVDALLDFADNALPGLRRANGWFCFDRELGGDLRGESPRYSVMVLLGMLRRAAAGRETSIDPAALHQQVHTQRDAFGVGDLGLLLWADSRIGSDRAELTMARLERLSSDQSALASLEGMEAAWFVLGAVHAVAAGLPAEPLVERSLAHLRTRRSRRSPLYRHYGDHRWRAVLPNFATQIYSLMALTEVARHELAPTAQAEAVGLADLLIHLRTDDAGWPWLFHADKATVVEPYEVYSVHQDAMAPMALLVAERGDRRRPIRPGGGGWPALVLRAQRALRPVLRAGQFVRPPFDPPTRVAEPSQPRRSTRHSVSRSARGHDWTSARWS